MRMSAPATMAVASSGRRHGSPFHRAAMAPLFIMPPVVEGSLRG